MAIVTILNFVKVLHFVFMGSDMQGQRGSCLCHLLFSYYQFIFWYFDIWHVVVVSLFVYLRFMLLLVY